MKNQFYVSGIHTNTGKTHFSAIFCKLFDFNYFKLIQAGYPKDSDFVKNINPNKKILEGYVLNTPKSPHIAKKLENATYKGYDIKIPNISKLLIELAGGLYTPLDEKITMIDYMSSNKRPTFLVAKYYLGAINHILLSLNALKNKNIPILALVMMGVKNDIFDDFIRTYIDIPILHLNFYKNKKNEKFIKQILDLKIL